jgi:molybdopterin converting factor small subunit
MLGLPDDVVRVVFVNGRARPRDWALSDGDELGIFPPIGGG